MSLFDCRGVPASTANVRALQACEQAVELTASYFLDPLAVIQEVLDEEPYCAAAHCVRAGLAVTATDKSWCR
jgi:hypothetical protein